MKCPMKGMDHGSHGHTIAKAVTGAVAVSTGKKTGRGMMSQLAKHPWALLGIGLVGGYMIHKYRKNIIGCANGLGDKSKDFVMQQKENLEDIVAETKQSSEDTLN